MHSVYMPIETRSNSALFRRAEQLKRWEDSETNKVSPSQPKDKKNRIKFSDGCVFLAACAASDTEEVERLLNLGTDINTANVDGLTALHQACIDNNLEMVQFLVEKGCDVNRGDNEGWTPLHATASCGFISIAKYLIEHGANVAAVNNDGDLPIDISESNEMEEYLSDVLDEQGIDCDEARSEEERIMLEDAKLMLNSNKFQDRIHPRTGASALHVAAAKGYIKVMNILIQVGADLNAQDNDGWTPLHAAAHWGQKDACAVLADNLANMDIQNLAGQTCFDVADATVVKHLEELKKKQATMQKDKPEIQAILQRTSNRPALKRRTSVTRMSNQEKSKSVMKDTKSERAQIENLSLPEEETEEDKERKRNEQILQKLYDVTPKEKEVSPKKAPTVETTPSEPKAPGLERIPSWKKVIRRASEENAVPEVSEITLKRPKKNDDSVEKNGPGEKKEEGSVPPHFPTSLCTEAVIECCSDPTTPTTPTDSSSESIYQDKRRPFIPPVRDDESELQRKAHAKRVRETRRSTQGVLLEDIKSAELQFLMNTQKDAAKRQADELSTESPDKENNKETEKSSEKTAENSKNQKSTSGLQNNQKSENKIPEKSDIESKTMSDSTATESEPSVTLVLKSKSGGSPEDTGSPDNRTSLGTQAAIQRRKRPKRRSTGVVYLDSDDGQEEKENSKDKDSGSTSESGQAERARHRYGSSSSLPDSASETSSRSDTPSRFSSLSSRSSLNEDDNKDYKKLYEEVRKENDRLKENLRKTEEELEKTKKQLQKLSQNSNKNSISETEKKERRALERKVSEMEEELKQCEKLKADNERLRDENSALIRVISKLSQ